MMQSSDNLDARYYHLVVLFAFANYIWPVTIIGLPIVVFTGNFGPYGNMLMFSAICAGLFVPYIIGCILIHYISMRKEEYRTSYYGKTMPNRAKQIGRSLSGWV